jgi:RecA-family ATPase
VGVAALVGSSDSGKSTLLRGLAMAVSSGARRYLGFELLPKHHSAIYVSTEDDAAAIGALMQRQLEELCTPKEAYATLDFIFDTENLLDTLDRNLEERPADLVIVDAFADLYTGPMNENNRVRSFLNCFSQLAHKHSTLFIFLHHTGKRTESLAPSKHNAIGSQGFEAKMRLMMELRPDPERHDIRHLCIVKGNYLSNDYKHDSFVLRFTPGLNFVATGERVPFALLRERSEASDIRDERLNEARALRAEGKTLQQIADALGYKSVAAVHYLLK